MKTFNRIWNWLLKPELALCKWWERPTKAEIDWSNRRANARWN